MLAVDTDNPYDIESIFGELFRTNPNFENDMAFIVNARADITALLGALESVTTSTECHLGRIEMMVREHGRLKAKAEALEQALKSMSHSKSNYRMCCQACVKRDCCPYKEPFGRFECFEFDEARFAGVGDSG